MRKIVMVGTLVLALTGIASAGDRPVFELVESVPVETSWDRPDVRNTQEVWVEMIRGAEQTLDLAQFYLATRDFEPLEPVLAEIVAAAGRGVRVRLLIELEMLDQSTEALDLLAPFPNIEIVTFDIHEITGGILHAKYFIVDGREAFVGSQNFDWRAIKHIHELGLRINDAATVGELVDIFEADWAFMTTGDWAAAGPPSPASEGPPSPALGRPPPPVAERRLSSVVASPLDLNPPGIPAALGELVRLIDGAERSVVVQVMSYSLNRGDPEPWRVIDDALRRAAARGVEVRLNLADWTLKESRIDALKSLTSTENITVRFNSIPQWSGGYIPYSRVDHTKYMVVDDSVGWLGTSNWSEGYFTESRNIEVIVTAPAVVSRLVKIFEQGWNGPYAHDLDPAKQYEPPIHD